MKNKHSRRQILRASSVALGSTLPVTGCVGGGGGTGNGGSGNGESGGSQNSNQKSGSTAKQMTVGVGSWNYTESFILGHMFLAVLKENTNHVLFNEINYGGNAEVFEGFTKKRAYEDGKKVTNPTKRAFHVYPDYTGTMWLANPPIKKEPKPTAKKQYRAVKEQMESTYEMKILDYTPFQNSFAFATDQETLERTGIKTISDLAEYINQGNYDVTLAMQSDFYNRADGWPGMIDHYGFDKQNVKTWENKHDGIVRTTVGAEVKYIKQGKADIGIVYTTDAVIKKLNLTILKDDKAFWPFYNIVPVVASEVATKEVTRNLNDVIGTLDSAETMRTLNGRVSFEDKEPKAVARSFLSEKGVI